MHRAPAMLRSQLAPVFADLLGVLKDQESRLAALETMLDRPDALNMKGTR